MSSGLQVYERIKRHLRDRDLKFNTHDEDLTITLIAQGDDLPQPTIIHVIDRVSVVQIVSPIPGKIPEDKRMEAAVALAIANWGMINGSFELDMSDGEIRFKIAQSYDGTELNEEIMDYMLGITFVTTDKFNDKFFALGMGLMSLEQFIQKVSE